MASQDAAELRGRPAVEKSAVENVVKSRPAVFLLCSSCFSYCHGSLGGDCAVCQRKVSRQMTTHSRVLGEPQFQTPRVPQCDRCVIDGL